MPFLLADIAPPDNSIWWKLAIALVTGMLGLIFWFLRDMKMTADEDRRAILATVTMMGVELPKSINAVRDQVARQNGAIGEIEREIMLRVEFATEQRDQNRKEHLEFYSALRDLTAMVGDRRKSWDRQ